MKNERKPSCIRRYMKEKDEGEIAGLSSYALPFALATAPHYIHPAAILSLPTCATAAHTGSAFDVADVAYRQRVRYATCCGKRHERA